LAASVGVLTKSRREVRPYEVRSRLTAACLRARSCACHPERCYSLRIPGEPSVEPAEEVGFVVRSRQLRDLLLDGIAARDLDDTGSGARGRSRRVLLPRPELAAQPVRPRLRMGAGRPRAGLGRRHPNTSVRRCGAHHVVGTSGTNAAVALRTGAEDDSRSAGRASGLTFPMENLRSTIWCATSRESVRGREARLGR
jgi:hypothetical protein